MEEMLVNIKSRWAVLKLELLNTGKLTDDDLRLIIRAQQDMADVQFKRALPIVVAGFKDAVKSSIVDWGASRRRTVVFNDGNTRNYNKFVRTIARGFVKDIDMIHQALFDKAIVEGSYEVEIGRFQTKRVGLLHSDSDQNPRSAPLYLARIAALPIEYLREETISSASRYEQRLIAAAKRSLRHGNPDEEEYPWAIKRLRSRKMVSSLPVGEVALLLDGKAGTLHCSSEIPEGGVVSGFFRVSTSKPNRGVFAPKPW